MNRTTVRALLFACVVLGSRALPLRAVVQPRNGSAREKAFRHPDLYVREFQQRISDLDPALAAAAEAELRSLGISKDSGFYDSRVGRWSSLILTEPLIPGTGVGNNLRWSGSGERPPDDTVQDQTWAALSAYLARHQAAFRLDAAEFGAARVTILEKGNLVYVYVPRVVGSVAVRNSSIGATINHGNLVLLGLQNWGDVWTELSPAISAEQARAAVGSHAQPFAARFEKTPHLELIPMAEGGGISYRLAWAVDARLDGDIGNWEGLVDARTGELIAFEDRNDYAQRTIVGGVYPVSNDQRPPDGIEQTGWPMPFADVHIGGDTFYTDAGGNIGCATGTISTSLSGLFVNMFDNCGAINETSSGSLDLGSGPLASDTDCKVPTGHSPGDTKSSRSGYYELNQLIDQARGWIPTNSWIQQQLTANMNISSTCNAFWDGSTVNFFKSGGGCANTGEIAAVFDHEWGHGLDQNDSNGMISSPGEAIADMHAALRLKVSCIGRGFFPGGVCDGYGDTCIGTPADGCTGVRDIDYANHVCNLPHGITWITSGFTSGQCSPGRPACPGGGGGPCGHEVHCEGQIVAEAGWDLASRDLVAAPFNYDTNTALEITTRLFYLGAQPVTDWYTCSVGGGCGATGGYLSLLAADDDNGNVNDGTPHMTAIRAAFERHEIHCATPAALNSGCVGGPATAPTVTVTPLDASAVVSWAPVTGAASYFVYRTDGVHDCDFGKIKVGTTSSLTFTDFGLQNGRTYFYSVIPVGSNNACLGPMSECATATPVAGPNLGVQAGTQLAVSGGDGDAFLDNCETGTITFTVANTGTGALTNVRLVAVTPLTHPSTVVTTALPAPIAASLDECNATQGAFSFVPQGMSFGQTTQLQVDVTADELGGETRSQILSVPNVETDLAPVASRAYSFEASLNGWKITSGTYSFATPGANGTGFHLSSSENVANACDIIDSPTFALTPTSTLSLYDRYTTQSPDRANVAVRDVSTDTRTTIVPSSGRLYDLAPDTPNGACVTKSQAGWAGSKPTFAVSTWDASALNPGGAFTGRAVKLEVAYATDASTSLAGFDFDEVTLTDIGDLVPDAQSNTCVAQSVAPVALAVDSGGNGVLDPNETALLEPTWANTGFLSIGLTGTLSAFTGPGDGGPVTYNIPDPSGDYGTIGVGTQAACPGCYSLSIVAASRPTQHWDATVLEAVSPTATAKTWNLHVGGSFTDVDPNLASDPFYPSIETIYHFGVTVGCGDGSTYCPTQNTERQEMAVFLLKASQGAGYVPPTPGPTPTFVDVTGGIYRPWIEDLFTRGITSGCQAPGDPLAYCPDHDILRQEMAVFLLKTLLGSDHVPPAPSPFPPGLFSDVPDDGYRPWIEELYNLGITGGCQLPGDPLAFCPTAPVTRQQMAAFLKITFGLVLYGP